MFRSYITIALRNLWRNKLYSLLNIGVLALGMACCLLIAVFVYDEWSHDRFHRNFDHIYRVIEKQKQPEGIFDVAVTPGPLAAELSKNFPEVEQTLRLGQWSGLITHGSRSVEPESMLIADPTIFSLFSFPLVAGTPAAVFRNPDEIILTEATAERLFGADWRRKKVMGQSITFNKAHTLTLVGIARNPPRQSHIQFEVLLPFKWLESNDEWSSKWNSNSYHTYVQLRPGTEHDAAAFGNKITDLLKSYGGSEQTQLLLQPLSDVYLISRFSFGTDWGKRSDIRYIRIFAAVGLIVLLTAVINFINLATARTSQRAKEVGIRKTVGARRWSVVGQFMLESLLMAVISVFMAIFLAEVLLPLFNNLSDKALQLPYGQPAFWLAMTALTAGVTLLTGLYPAWFLSSFRPIRVLKGVFDVRTGRSFRQWLVVGQFVLSIVLIVGTLFIYSQLFYIQSRRLGFDQSQLLYVRLKGDMRANAMLFKSEVEKLAGVAQASAASSTLVEVLNSSLVTWEGQPAGDEFHITHMNVDADFLPTTGLALVAGRNFSTQITSDTSSTMGTYLINETAARRMGWSLESALGKKINFWGADGKVIGVLKDFHFRSLHVAIEPFILRFQPKNYYFNLLVKTQPGGVQRTLADISSLYRKLDPDHPISYGFVDQDLAAQYMAEQRTGRIILSFAVLTILVASLGLFGLATFTAEQRTKEIGIRKVLGASVASVVGLLSRDFMRLVVIAFVIAVPIAWYAIHLWLQHFSFRIDIGWWYFATAGVLALGVALLPVGYQAIKAALANPANSLKSE